MNDDDLIRRGDAKALCDRYPYVEGVKDALKDLPAVSIQPMIDKAVAQMKAERDATVGALKNLNDEVELLGVLLSGLEPKRQEALEKGAFPKTNGESLWASTMRITTILARIKKGKL